MGRRRRLEHRRLRLALVRPRGDAGRNSRRRTHRLCRAAPPAAVRGRPALHRPPPPSRGRGGEARRDVSRERRGARARLRRRDDQCAAAPRDGAGEFVELDEPHRLVFTWGWEPGKDGPNPVPPGSSTIEIELVPQGDGTLLRFTHRDLPGAEAAESHGHGWDHYLERLQIAARGGDAGADPWLTGDMQ